MYRVCKDSCCFHNFHGPIHRVIPYDHLVQQCCKCNKIRTIHVDHLSNFINHHKWQKYDKSNRWLRSKRRDLKFMCYS